MSDSSSIEWTDATWNPVRGCSKVSPGCKHCYAETFAERFRGVEGHAYEQGFDLRLVPKALAIPLHWTRPRFVFVNSMSDLFHEDVPFEYIAAVFGVMAACPQHTFQVLTKRADRMAAFFVWIRKQWEETRGRRESTSGIADIATAEAIPYLYDGKGPVLPALVGASWRDWPLPNVWLGVSVESQQYADERIPKLLECPAAVRFLSVEPLLGPIDRWHFHWPSPLGTGGYLSPLSGIWLPHEHAVQRSLVHQDGPRIGWVIVGGESGPGAREMDPAWVRSIRDQCVAASVPFFFKQWGGVRKKVKGRTLDGRTWDEMPKAAKKSRSAA